MTHPHRSTRSRGCMLVASGCLVVLAVIGLVACTGAFATGRILDSGPNALLEVDERWTVEGQPERPASTIADDLLASCHPMGNGIAVLFHHAWYNTITSGYDNRLWLEGPEGTYESIGLYTWSNKVFVRDQTHANGYDNHILVCSPMPSW